MQTLKAGRRIIAVFAFLPMILPVEAIAKFAPDQGRATFHTAHFRIHYPPHYRAFAEAASDRLEEAYSLLGTELGWAPRGKIEVVVRGDTDVANGSAEVFPYNRIVLNAVAPEPWGFFSESDDWIRTLALHELTHVIAGDETRGGFHLLRSVIGSAAKVNPYQPVWLVEGLAVYEETAKTSRGRGRSVWSDMVLRGAVEGASEITLDRLNDGLRPWPMGHTPYLYGYVLIQALADRSGASAPARLSTANAGSFPFRVDAVARSTLGVGYAELWREVAARLEREYRADLARIDREPLTPTALLTDSGRRTRGLVATAPDEFIFIRDSAAEGSGLSKLRHGRVHRLTDWRWEGGTRLRLAPGGRAVLYSRIAPYLEHSLFSDLYLYDLESGRETQLTFGARGADPEVSQDFAWDARAGRIARGRIFYVKNLPDGNQAIAVLSAGSDGDEERLLYSGAGFARLGAPALERGNRRDRLAFAEKTRTAGERIRLLDLDSAAGRPEFLTPMNSAREIATTPEWDFDGSLLYSGGAGGVFNLFRIAPARDGRRPGLPERLTNVRTGALQPARFAADGPLYAMVYGPRGWNPAEVRPGKFSAVGPGVRTLAEKLTGAPGAPAPEAPVPPAAREEAGYSVLPALWPKYWAPDVRKVADGWTLGIQTASYDAWENHRYRLFGGMDTRARFPIWNLNYQFDGFYPTLEFSVRRENRYFATYLESNQIDTNEARVYMPAGWNSYVILGFTAATSRFLNEEKESTGGFELGWSFDRMRTHDDSIDPGGEYGLRGRAGLTGYFAGKERFSALDARFDARVPSLFGRHFFRIVANYGKANNERLSALYFLSGGEETIAAQADHLLRGYPQGTVFGREILTSNFEYVFPVADLFRGFGTFPIFFERARMKLFFDAGSAEYVDADAVKYRRWPNAVGAHLLGDLNLLYRVPVTLGVGFDYGLARDLGGESRVVFGLFSNLP